MNIKEVKDLIQDILQSDISEFELEHTGTKVRIRRGFVAENGASAHVVAVGAKPASGGREQLPAFNASAAGASMDEIAREDGIHTVTSPIVGTFYRAPAPEAEPYIKIGSKVEKGTILCIVEAMKLMNEIPSDAAGEVVEIYVENGHAVEFGQKLFGIRAHK
jgi:acetyl-CoA carboxylase biotin carboxyl carrier protein